MEGRLTEEGKAWGRAATQFAQSIAAIPGASPKGRALGQPVHPAPSDTPEDFGGAFSLCASPGRLFSFGRVFSRREEVVTVALGPAEVCPRSPCFPRHLALPSLFL